MYKSPIQILTEEPQFDIDGEICRCVQNMGIEVDKMELERALRYDRGQYIKGYNDAINEVLELFDDFNDGTFLWGGLRAKIQKLGTNIEVDDFKYLLGENQTEYIKLLKGALARQQQITSNAIAKIKAMIKSGQMWTPVSEEPPEDGQECLVTAKALNNKFYIDIATFATDLYSVDKYSFRDRKSESGWYFTDPDLGELELPDVVAWQPLPDPYKRDER